MISIALIRVVQLVFRLSKFVGLFLFKSLLLSSFLVVILRFLILCFFLFSLDPFFALNHLLLSPIKYVLFVKYGVCKLVFEILVAQELSDSWCEYLLLQDLVDIRPLVWILLNKTTYKAAKFDAKSVW